MIETFRNLATSMRIYQRNVSGRKFEPEAPYMKFVVKPGNTCLHFGGSDGRHSYLMSQLIGPTGKVHVYEPSNYSYAIMSRLIRWHGLKNVTPHNAANSLAKTVVALEIGIFILERRSEIEVFRAQTFSSYRRLRPVPRKKPQHGP